MSAGSDFYKKLALECSAQQIAVDLFVFSNSSQFLDLPTICKLLFILSINPLYISISYCSQVFIRTSQILSKLSLY